MIRRALLLGALVAAGCGSSSEVRYERVTTTTSAADQLSGRIGETVTFPDGVAISLAEPTPHGDGGTTAGDADGTDLAFELRLTNDSYVAYDPGYTVIRLDSGGSKALQLFDAANDIGLGLDKVAPGDEEVFHLVFTVADPDDLVFTFRRDDDGTSATITG